jgi:hypothetical protein
LYAFLMSPMRAICTAHHIPRHLTIRMRYGKAYKLWSSSVCNLLQSPTSSSLLDPNILVSTLFSYTINQSINQSINQCSSLSARDQVSRRFKIIYYTRWPEDGPRAETHSKRLCIKVKINVSLCFNWTSLHEVVLGDWSYSSTYSRPRHWTEVNGQLHAHTTGYEAGWDLESVVKRKIPSQCRDSNLRSSSP